MSTARLAPILFAAALAAPLAGCDAADDDAPHHPSAYDQLGAMQPFALDPATTEVGLRARLDRGAEVDETWAELAVTTGELRVGRGGGDALVLDDMIMAFDDVALPTDLGPGDVELTDVHVHFARAVTCDHTAWTDDGAAAFCAGAADLTLDWKVRIGDDVWPLGSQTMTGVELDVMVTTEDDRLRLELGGKVSGVAWSWADVVALGDLSIWLRGYTARD